MTRMNFDQVVDFIMDRLAVAEPEQRATRDKVRKRVHYGLGNGSLPRLDLQTLDVDRDALIYWARQKWPGKFKIPIRINVDLEERVALTDRIDGLQLPSDISACRALLQQSRLLLQLLEAKCKAQESVIADLRPDAERYREIRQKNQQSAKKRRS